MSTVIVHIPVAPERAADVVAATRAAQEEWLAPPECRSVRILAAAGGDDVTVITDWESAEAQSRVESQPAAREFLARIGEMASGPSTAGLYRDA